MSGNDDEQNIINGEAPKVVPSFTCFVHSGVWTFLFKFKDTVHVFNVLKHNVPYHFMLSVLNNRIIVVK